MKNLLITFVAPWLLASVASAGQPTLLNDRQMDGMTAGQVTAEIQAGAPPPAISLQKMQSQAPSFSVSLEPTQSDTTPFSISIQQSMTPSPFPAFMSTGIQSGSLLPSLLPQ